MSQDLTQDFVYLSRMRLASQSLSELGLYH